MFFLPLNNEHPFFQFGSAGFGCLCGRKGSNHQGNCHWVVLENCQGQLQIRNVIRIPLTRLRAQNPSTFNEHINSLLLGDVVMKPAKHLIGVNGFVDIFNQILKHQALLTGTMCRHPQPAFAHVVVNEKYVTLMKS